MLDSRIQLHPRNARLHNQREVYTGWDNTLRTYFAHVVDGHDATGSEIRTLSLGTRVGEFTDTAALIDAVRPYAEIPDDLPALLAARHSAEVATAMHDADLPSHCEVTDAALSDSAQHGIDGRDYSESLHDEDNFQAGLGL